MSFTNQADSPSDPQVNGGSGTYTTGPAFLNGTGGTGQPYVFAWLPSGRTRALGTTVDDLYNVTDDLRESKVTYIRGLKETISLATNTNVAWRWRRIVVFWKDVLVLNPSSNYRDLWYDPNVSPSTTGRGYVRVFNSLNTTRYAALTDLIFVGTQDKDWTDPFTAALDKSRVDVKYDKTITIQSRTNTGTDLTFHRWHPVNKTMIYDDEQVGASWNSSFYSSNARGSCGDMVVIDIIRGGINSGGSDRMRLVSDATFYWHER